MEQEFQKELTAFKIGFKRYGLSSLTTFLTIFFVTFSSIIASTDLTSELANRAFWVSVIVTAARAGVKAVVELVINVFSNKK